MGARSLPAASGRISARVQAEIQRVEEWNAKHPAGTPVTVTNDDKTETQTKTRSAAWMLGADDSSPGHSAVVLLEGRSGAFLLSRCKPRRAGRKEA
jgi:hypothetical protein